MQCGGKQEISRPMHDFKRAYVEEAGGGMDEKGVYMRINM